MHYFCTVRLKERFVPTLKLCSSCHPFLLDCIHGGFFFVRCNCIPAICFVDQYCRSLTNFSWVRLLFEDCRFILQLEKTENKDREAIEKEAVEKATKKIEKVRREWEQGKKGKKRNKASKKEN